LIRAGRSDVEHEPGRHAAEAALTPLDFARRTRRLHGAREALVDGGLRLTYEQFFDRCDRWTAALQGLGVRPGTRGTSR